MKKIIKPVLSFLFTVLVVSVFMFGSYWLNANRISKWPSVEGTVTRTLIMHERAHHRRYYAPAIQYKCRIDGKEYKGLSYYSTGRVRFLGNASGFRSEDDARAYASKFPEGKKIIVHYKPDRPIKQAIEK